MRDLYKLSFLYMVLLGMVTLWLGCGSTVETPTYPVDADAEMASNLDSPSAQALDVTLAADKTGPLSAGETVRLTATVETIRGSSLNFNWINVTGYGELSDTRSNTVTWTAPADVESGQVKVEVIQLVVTVISQLISVDDSGVKTDTQILTETRTMPLTTVGS